MDITKRNPHSRDIDGIKLEEKRQTDSVTSLRFTQLRIVRQTLWKKWAHDLLVKEEVVKNTYVVH